MNNGYRKISLLTLFLILAAAGTLYGAVPDRGQTGAGLREFGAAGEIVISCLEIIPGLIPRDDFIRKPFMRKKIRAAWLSWVFYPPALFLAISLLWFAVIRKKRTGEFFLKWEMLGSLVYLTVMALTLFNSPLLTHADLETARYQFSLAALFRALLLTAVPSLVQFAGNLIRKNPPGRSVADALLLWYWSYFYTASLYVLARPMTEFV